MSNHPRFCRKHLNKEVALLSCALLASLAATAQDTAQARALEEVVVTAQKRSQSAQDVPVAITAFSGDSARELGMETATDIAAQTPGLSTSNHNTPIFSIRGVGLEDYNTNNSSAVGVYIDQVYMSSPVYLTGQMLDIAQIEVLKGPQGTLYGRNTTGGAITFVSNKPTSETSGYVNLKYGRFERSELDAALGGALTDKLDGRLALSAQYDGRGWQTNQATGSDLGRRDRYALRGQLQFYPTESSDVLLDVHASRDRSDDASGLDDTANGLSNALLGTDWTLGDRRKAVSKFDPKRDEEGIGFALTANVELGFASLTSVTAYDQYEMDSTRNLDGGYLIGNDQYDQDITAKQVSQELRLTSNRGGNFDWIVGINVSRESMDGAANVGLNDLLDLLLVTPPPGGAGLDPLNPANYPNSNLDFAGTGAGAASTLYDQELTTYGVFAHTETRLTDQLRLTAGLRYSYDDVEFESLLIDNSTGGELIGIGPGTGVIGTFFAGVPVATGAPFNAVEPSNESESNLSGKLGLDYTPNDDWLLYASISTGYKGGRFFTGAVPTADFLTYVEPEEVLAFEAGFKATLLNGVMQMNGAAFNYDYDNRQTTVSAFKVVPVTYLTNLPDSEMQGAEVEIQWLATENLELRGGVAYLDTEATSEARVAPGITLISSVEGSEVAQAPEWSYNAVAAYNFSLPANIAGRFQVDYSWKDDYIVFMGETYRVDPVSSLNARLGFTSLNETWEVALWGKNLEDKNRVTYAYATSLGLYKKYQMPMTYGVELRYNFH